MALQAYNNKSLNRMGTMHAYHIKIADRTPREMAMRIAIANAIPKPVTSGLLSLTMILAPGFGSVAIK
jgi:hypothetical protein